ncbi:unnamed protein product [Malus baccata var. baccata]
MERCTTIWPTKWIPTTPGFLSKANGTTTTDRSIFMRLDPNDKVCKKVQFGAFWSSFEQKMDITCLESNGWTKLKIKGGSKGKSMQKDAFLSLLEQIRAWNGHHILGAKRMDEIEDLKMMFPT